MGKLLFLLVLLLTGCGVRLTDEQTSQLSQAKADVEASRLTVDADARSDLLQAAGARLMAGLADVDLPPPYVTPAQLVDPAGQPTALVPAELKASKAAEEAPPSGWLNLALGGAGGLALMALSVLRFSPGAFGVVAQLAHTLLAPKATREMREVQVKSTVIAEQAIQYGHQITEIAKAAGLEPTVLRIQEGAIKVQDDLGIRPQLQAILAGVKTRTAENKA
jgi:hypothetical protein